ncbi:ML2 [Symbiodinium natans]|uniref:ML2 protein n=1 Tax=Symbiodinium natans TaxID=878477 RepID=A0A812RH67_9DINO|nr:ML2 [Symbiodinium natans]
MLLADKPILRSQLCCSIPCVVYGRSEPICGHGINHQSLQISRSAAGVAAFVFSLRRRQASVVQRRAAQGSGGQSSSACVVVCGIPGSGKSTLCRLLCAAIEDSVWHNQDHFPAGPTAKVHFLRGVQSSLDTAAHSDRPGLVCIDKVNVQKVHRDGFWQQAEAVGWKEKGGITIFCELTSIDDLLKHCQSRIEQRGAAHNSLHPSPKLPAILRRQQLSWEPLDEGELARFDAHVEIDVGVQAVDKAMKVITALRRLGWSPRLRSLASANPESDEADCPMPVMPWVLLYPLQTHRSICPGNVSRERKSL